MKGEEKELPDRLQSLLRGTIAFIVVVLFTLAMAMVWTIATTAST